MSVRRDSKIVDESRPASVAKCPICERPRETAFAPFCSRRCADVDLSRWMTGSYAIEGDTIDENDED